MPGGRPPLGPSLVDQMDGPPEEKHRLKVILELISKQKTAEEACKALGIERAQLYVLVNEVLQSGLEALLPKKRGRPPKEPTSPEKEEIRMLHGKVADLQLELHAARIREEIAETMPHVLLRGKAKKKEPEKRLGKKPW